MLYLLTGVILGILFAASMLALEFSKMLFRYYTGYRKMELPELVVRHAQFYQFEHDWDSYDPSIKVLIGWSALERWFIRRAISKVSL